MREKFEILAKISGWNGSLSSPSSSEFSTDSESLSKLIEHVIIVLERKEITCVELNRSLERQQLELEASREQVNLASTRLKEMRERLTENESQIIELNSKISTLTAQIMNLEQILKREKSQAEWSMQELEKTLDAFAAFRKEQIVLLAEARSQADLSNSQSQEVQKRLQRTLQSLKEREKQFFDLQESLAQTKSQLSANEANFTREMNSNSRMIELYKNASEEAAERITLLQNEIEELREVLSNFEAQESGHTADLQAELEDRENLIKLKEEQLEKMRIALDGLLKVAKASTDESLSLTADILNEFSNEDVDASNVSVKQIYSEYSVCRGKLARAEEECSQLRITMQEMINEINSRAPLFDSLKADNSRLQGDVALLTEQLINAATSRDAAITDRATLERNLANLQVEMEALQQECSDLSQQVQRLLLEIESSSSSNANVQNNKRQRNVNSEILRASEIITENFVDITSIAQLQQRNQELLRGLRSITAKYEALEKEKESPQLRAQLEAALRELDEMHDARKRQAQMVETIIKTKTSDNNNANNVNSPKTPIISDTFALELDQLKRQLETKQETLKMSLSELETVKKDLVEEKVSKARLSAQLELSEERLKILNETLQQERLESASMRERLAVQMDSFNQAQTSSYKLMADLTSSQERENRLHARIEKLQNEINSLVIETSKLQQEVSSSSGERDRLNGILSSMQGVLNEHEASEATLKRHFTAQVEFMERELESSRSRITEITNSHSSVLSALERDRSELFRKLESLSEELTQKKETNLRLEGSLLQAQEKISDLERVLQQAATESVHDENNVKTFELRIRALSTELKNVQSNLQQSNSRIIELEGQVGQIEELKLQLESEKENSLAKETNLQESLAELGHLKGDKERLEEELNTLREELVSSQEQVKLLNEEIEKLQEQIKSQSAVLKSVEEEKQQLQAQLNEAKSIQLTLESSLTAGESEKNHLKTTIGNLEERLQSLQEQNEKLLDEAQNSVFEGGEDGDGENSLGVIKFLRSEKDKLQVEREKLLSEVRQYQLQVEEAQRTLHLERQAIASQSADYARLLAEVERLNSLRESGALHQHETAQMRMKITILENQLIEKNSSIAPLKESLETAQGEIDQLKESLAMIQTDRDSWKSRFENAISTASNSNSPLETELKQVKMQSEMFRQRALTLTKNLAEVRSAAQKEIEGLQKEISELNSKLESAAVVVTPMDVEMTHTESPVHEEQVAAIVKESSASEQEIEPEQAEPEAEVEEKDKVEDDSDTNSDSDYEEPIESVSVESINVSESASIPEPLAVTESVTTVNEPSIPATLSESASPVSNLAATNIEPSVPVTSTEVPRKKIVSLAGIVGSSSTTTPAMITTASGKKFVPVTFPDPPAANTSNASAAAAASGGSPVKSKAKKIKKGLIKKKNKINKNSE